MRQITDSMKLEAALAGRRAVVLFHARWCPYCRAFKPVFDELAPGAKGHEVLEVVLDDEDNPLWDKYGIDAAPTVMFFDGGKVAKRLDARRGVGLEAADLKRAIGKTAARAPSKKKLRPRKR